MTLSERLEAGAGFLAALSLTVLGCGVAGAAGLRPAEPAERAVVAQVAVSPVPLQLRFAAPVEVAPAEVPAPAPAPAPAPEPRPAAAAADPLCSGAGWQARRGAAALASLRRPPGGVEVAFLPGRPDVLGSALLQERRVEVYVRPCGAQSDALLRHVVAHELGHVLDVTRLSDEDRAAWRAERGIPASSPWYGCSACTDFATPAGDFAETYAQWQRGATTSRSELAPAASPAELDRLAERFFR